MATSSRLPARARRNIPAAAPALRSSTSTSSGITGVACIRATLEKANATGDDILGIGITSFGNGLTFLGKNGENVGPCAFSIDSRSADVVKNYYATAAADKIREIIKCDIMILLPRPHPPLVQGE